MTGDDDVDVEAVAEIAPTGIVRDEHGNTVRYPYDAESYTVAEYDSQAALQDAADWERGR